MIECLEKIIILRGFWFHFQETCCTVYFLHSLAFLILKNVHIHLLLKPEITDRGIKYLR